MTLISPLVSSLCTIQQRTAFAPRSGRLFVLVASILVLGFTSALATPITVPNGSFESPGSPTQTSNVYTIAPGWVFNMKAGSVFGTESIASNFSSEGAAAGNNAAFINNDYPDVTDTITSASSLAKIAPLTTYTLTVAIGNNQSADNRLYGSPGNVTFSLLANGVAFATELVGNGTVANGTFQDFTLTYTTPASSWVVGENLTIQLATLPEEGSAYKPAFDNVTLDATALPVTDVAVVPEPSTMALLLSGLLTLCLLLRRQSTLAQR